MRVEMRLTTKGRYAVMAICDLAQSGSSEAVTLAAIAERQRLSLSYLEQLFARLRRAGIVRSIRGPGGGYLLAMPAGELPVAAVMEAVEEPIRATRCLPGAPEGCTGNPSPCQTHQLWDELGHQIRLYLGSVTIEDVVAGRIQGTSQLFPADGRDVGAAAE